MIHQLIRTIFLVVVVYIEILMIILFARGKQIINPIEELKQRPVLFVIALVVWVICLFIAPKET